MVESHSLEYLDTQISLQIIARDTEDFYDELKIIIKCSQESSYIHTYEYLMTNSGALNAL